MKIAQRLLEGVAPENKETVSCLSEEYERIRIILACRSRKKAEVLSRHYENVSQKEHYYLTLKIWIYATCKTSKISVNDC